MSFYMFLEPAYLLQTIVLALSIFNLVAFLWLAMTVWLNGDRKSGIARLGVVGLGLSALFFFIHALLISGPLTQSSRFSHARVFMASHLAASTWCTVYLVCYWPVLCSDDKRRLAQTASILIGTLSADILAASSYYCSSSINQPSPMKEL